MRFRVDERHVAHRAVDGEVIAIHFVSGTYFIMPATAGEVWQMLAAGVPLPDVVARCQDAGATPETVASEIQGFVDQLLAADLIEPDGDLADAAPPALPTISAYSTPTLEKFEDMAELIMLDPVHDVSDAGWPHRPQAVT